MKYKVLFFQFACGLTLLALEDAEARQVSMGRDTEVACNRKSPLDLAGRAFVFNEAAALTTLGLNDVEKIP